MSRLIKTIAASAFALAACVCAAGQSVAKNERIAPRVGDAAKRSDAAARLEKLRQAGFDALYNLDYEEARRNFKEMQRQFPDHPAGARYLAASLLLETLNKSRRLSASLYSSDSFYAGSEDKPDPKVVAEFRNLTTQAKTLAEARLKRDKTDAEAMYFLGSEEALRAAFAAALERSFMTALKAGSSAVDIHRQTAKADPSNVDALLTVGLYDYVVGSLPLPVKIMASVGGIHGSKRRVLETLERVSREGTGARDDAKSLLIVLYKREARYKDALKAARSISNAYPRNYLLKMEVADALVALADDEKTKGDAASAAAHEKEAFEIFDRLLQRENASNFSPSLSHDLDFVHFNYGEALFTSGQYERAAKEFQLAAAQPKADAGLATMAHLHAARALDLIGKRDEALKEYRLVLARPNVYDSQDQAKRGLKEPYKAKQSKADD